MENAVMQQHYLEAELLLGYKYFELKDIVAKERSDAEQELYAARTDLSNVNAQYEKMRNSDLNNEEYFINRYKEEKALYDEKRRQAYDEALAKRDAAIQQEQARKQKEKEEFEKIKKTQTLILFGVGVLLAVLAVFMMIKGYAKTTKPGESNPLASLAVFVLAGAVVSIVFGYKTAQQTFIPSESALPEINVNFPSFMKWLFQKNGFDYFVNDYPAKSEGLIAQETEALRKIEALERKVEGVKMRECALEAREPSLQQILNVIPVYYFQKDAVTKMLFFYLNKRADTIKELINLYEQTVFEAALLKAVDNISVSVNKLSATLNDNFRTLGLQLGVLNETVCQNTKVQVLNKEKLSQIEDNNTKYYMEIINELQSLEVEFTVELDK